MTADVTTGLVLVFLSYHFALLLATTCVLFFNKKKEEQLEMMHFWGYIMESGFL